MLSGNQIVFKHRNFKEISADKMKLLVLFGFIFLFGWLGSNTKKPPGIAVTQKTLTPKDTIDFSTQVQPILIKNCSPCHFPGGKMYERMPFDQDTTIINHQAGILRRIKGAENDLIKTFVQQTRSIRK